MFFIEIKYTVPAPFVQHCGQHHPIVRLRGMARSVTPAVNG
jgi:hypothetical protein